MDDDPLTRRVSLEQTFLVIENGAREMIGPLIIARSSLACQKDEGTRYELFSHLT